MAERAVFFKGCWLWESFQYWTPWGARGDDMQHLGVRAASEVLNPRSPNFGCDIEVHTFQDVTAAHGDLSLGATFELRNLQLMLNLQDLAKTLGPLCWADDPDRTADVSTGGPYPGPATVAIPHDTPQAGWTPTQGRYVLLREPVSGEGFAAPIEAVGGGAITVTIPDGVTVTDQWVFVDVQAVLPDCAYVTMDPGSAEDAGDREDWRPDVLFQFRGPAKVLSAADHQVPRGNA